MTSIGHTPRGLIDLGDKRFAGLPKEQRDWLEQSLGSQFRVEDLSALHERANLTPTQRAILVGLRQTLTGELRANAGRALTKDGAKELPQIKAMTLAASRAPTGETELQQKVRSDLPQGLVGHEDQLEPFVELTRRYESPAWTTPPLMAIVGQQGHGKEEALRRYAELLLGEGAQVIYVDLGRFSGSSMASAFGKNGPLDLETLKTRVPGYEPPADKDGNVEKIPPAIICVRGVENLRTTSVDAAQSMVDLLTARKGTPGYVRVPFILDFEQQVGTPPRKLAIDALAEVGSRCLCATAEFKDLDPDTLASYAEPILLESLKLQGTGNTVLEIDDDADHILHKALATPFAPLEEIGPRLYEWIISKFDTATSVDRDVDVLRVSLNPKYTDDPAALDALVGALHQQYADLRLGADLFLVNIVGKQVEIDPRTKIAIDRGAQLAKTLQAMTMHIALGMPPVDPENARTVTALLGTLRVLGDELQSAITVARKQNDLGREDVLPTEESNALASAIGEASDALARLQQEGPGNLPAEWVVLVAQAASSWTTAASRIWQILDEGAAS